MVWHIALAEVINKGAFSPGVVNFARVDILWCEVSLSVAVLSNGRFSLSPNRIGSPCPSVHAEIRSVSRSDCSAVGHIISIGTFRSCQSVERRNGTPSSIIWARTRFLFLLKESATCL